MTYLDRAIKDGYAIITGPENKQKIIYVTSDNHTENYNDPEEKVRAEFWAELIYEYDYPAHRIKVEVTIPDRVPTDRADIVIFSDDECKKPYAVVECKRDGVTDAEFLQAIEQGVGNATWVKLRASYVVIIAGATRRVLDFSDDSTGILERENNIIADLPKAYGKPQAFRFYRGGEYTDVDGKKKKAPDIQPEKSCPLAHVPFGQVRRCAFRVLVYHNRVAVEFFHAVTDGTGGLIFLKTLVAEYLCQKYGITVPAEKGVLGRLEEPSPQELEDSFLRYAGQITASRKEQTAYHLSGTPEPDGFLDLTTLMLPVDAVKAKAKEFGVSVTEFIAAVMMKAISDLQTEKVPRRMRRRPVKVLLPVNLRGLFPSRTLRNFASYVTPEIDPRLGDYSLAEICKIVHYRMGLENDARMMAAKIATNVASERSAVLRAMPLFIKNIAMKAVFDLVGECKSCLCLSNLGLVQLPDAMAPYVARMDFIIGVQAKAPHNCGVVSWDGTMYINMIRNIREPELESHFYRVLHTLGLPVKVESNQRWT